MFHHKKGKSRFNRKEFLINTINIHINFKYNTIFHNTRYYPKKMIPKIQFNRKLSCGKKESRSYYEKPVLFYMRFN